MTRKQLNIFRHLRVLPFLALIQLYRWFLSPYFGRQCRFQPTCSVYAQDALKAHGVIRGLALTANRLRRCHPFKILGAGDGFVYDPVPLSPEKE